jgi:hypothetical protein
MYMDIWELNAMAGEIITKGVKGLDSVGSE